MPDWATLAKDVLAIILPVAATLATGIYGLVIRNRENRRKRETDDRAAVTEVATVETESWAAFVASHQAWTQHQEQVIARQAQRIDDQDDKISRMYDEVGTLRRAVIRAETRARAAVSFARDLILWAGEPYGPPPSPPPVIADDLDDLLDRLRHRPPET